MFEFSRSLAVVIGIDQYSNGIPSLQTAVNDAREIGRILKQEHKYDQVLLYFDRKATLQQLQHLLNEILVENTQPDDRLLFYFAGHGIALNGDEGPEGYLIPQDAKLGDPGSFLPMSQLQAALSQLPCRHFLGILDCCFAGAFRWSSTRDLGEVPQVLHKERYERFIQDPAWQVITSAASDQKAWDFLALNSERSQVGDHSPFAAALVEALAGQADIYPPSINGKPPGDGVITANELYLYLRHAVEPATEENCQRQTPGIWPLKKHDKGEYIFLAPGHPLNLPPAPPLDASKNPYRGLESYDEEHSELFFGRTELVEKLQNFVKTHPLIMVLGASGSGKSSLVKAGLIPELRQETTEQWSILPTIRPGETPLQALNNAFKNAHLPEVAAQSPQQNLAMSIDVWAKNSPNSKLLLFVDQSEEIITLCQNEDERKEFFQQILKAINVHRDKLRVVLSLRSDFEPQVRDAGLKFAHTAYDLGKTELKNRWQSGRFIVPAMTRGELREAIEKPAETRVMYFQPYELVEKLIDEVADMPGALPLLSFALSELYLKYLKRQWEAQNEGITIDRALTENDYQDLGGVIRALTQRADEEYDALVKEDVAYSQIIRHVMLRMVAIGGGELARRRVPLSELEYPREKNSFVNEVIERFTNARLLVKGEDAEGNPYVEPAHDALVKSWGKINLWLTERQDRKKTVQPLTPFPAIKSSLSRLTAKVSQPKNIACSLFNLVSSEPSISLSAQSGINPVNRKESEAPLKVNLQLQRELTIATNNWWSEKKQAGFLWNADPRLPQLVQIQQSEDDWLNARETDFIKQSSKKKRQNSIIRWSIAGSVIVGSVIFSAAVWVQWRTSEINQANSLGRYSQSLFSGHNELEAFVEAIKAGKILQKQHATDLEVMSALQEALYEGSERNRLEGHNSLVKCVSFSPDGKTLASASGDNTIKLWDLETGKEIRTLQGHGSAVSSVSFSPDGKTLASASVDRTIKLWNLKTSKEIRTLQHSSQVMRGSVHSVSFSPDGKTLASSSGDNTIKLWNLETGKEIRTLQGHDDAVYSVSFSPDGKTLASGSGDNTIKLWNLETGKEIRTLQGHDDAVNSVSFSPDGKTLASGSRDKTIKLWNLETSKEIRTLQGHGSSVDSVSFSPDGKTLASASEDKTIKLWNLKTSKEIRTLQGHSDWVMSVSFSPDGKTLASGSSDKTIKLWNLETSKKIRIFQGHNGPVYSVSFSPDGSTLTSGSYDQTIKLWDLETGKEIRILQGNDGSVNSVSFSPDGKTLASGGFNTIKLWDLKTGKEIRTLQGHDSWVNSVSFSPDGKTLATGNDHNTIKLWNLEAGKEIRTLQGHNGPVYSASFSPDGSTLASGSYDQTIKLWNLETGKEIRTLQGHEILVRSVSFSPDGSTLASGSEDKTIKLWNLETGKEIRTLKGHDDAVNSVSFSPDGKTLASGSRDKTIKLWNLETGKEIRTLQGHDDAVNSVSFSPDGKTLASGSRDKTIKLWNLDLSLDSLIGRSCDWVHNYLQNNPNVNESDRHLCDKVVLQK